MSSIRFLSDNLADNAVLSLSEGVENAQYPLTNIINNSPSIKFQSYTDTVKIVFDMVTTRDIDAIALVGDPNETLGFIFANMRYSATTDFSGSPVLPIEVSAEFNMGLELIDNISARYVEIELIGSTIVELGKIFIGKQVNLPYQNYSIGSFTYLHTDNSTIRGNQYGQNFVDVRNLQKKIRGAIDYANNEEMEILDDMFKYHGRHKPLWVIVDEGNGTTPDGRFRLSTYGYFEQVPAWQAASAGHYNTTMTIQEAI